MTATRDDTDQDQPTEAPQQPLEAVLLTPGVVEAVRSLVEIMERGGLTKLDLVHGDLSVSLRSDGVKRPTAPAAEVPPTLPSIEDTTDKTSAAPAQVAEAGGHVIASPMVGTFYNAPAPNAPPFVAVGDRVEVGQTVGIVEAMKIMNEIAAEQAGFVAAILVENGQPVEYGSPLIRLA